MQNTITISLRCVAFRSVAFRSISFCIVLFRAVLSDVKTRSGWICNSFSTGISEDDGDNPTERDPAMLRAALKAHAEQASKFPVCMYV